MSDALSSGHPALRAFFHMRGRNRSTLLAWQDYYESITETTKIKMKLSQSISTVFNSGWPGLSFAEA